MSRRGACSCEHVRHFDGGEGHEYGAAPAGARRAFHVGLVCDPCAASCMAEYLHAEGCAGQHPDTVPCAMAERARVWMITG